MVTVTVPAFLALRPPGACPANSSGLRTWRGRERTPERRACAPACGNREPQASCCLCACGLRAGSEAVTLCPSPPASPITRAGRGEQASECRWGERLPDGSWPL